MIFTTFRVVLFCGLILLVAYACLFGPETYGRLFGEDNTYRYRTGSLAVHYIDVGQGDCIAINLPDGKVVLIDGGESIYYSRVKNYLETRVVGRKKSIDYIINTHADSDHYGGLVGVLKDFNVETVYRPYNASESLLEVGEANAPMKLGPSYAEFIDAVYENANSVKFVCQGAEITDGEFYRLFFHTPGLETIYQIGASYSFNESSPIITLEYSNQVFVFTGDAGEISEGLFRERILDGECEIPIVFMGKTVHLKVGHHGASTSTKEQFLNFIDPVYAVISAGVNNFYGHPKTDLLERLADRIDDNNIFVTKDEGNIAFRCDGDSVKIFLRFDNSVNPSYAFVVCIFATFMLCFCIPMKGDTHAKFSNTSSNSQKVS